MHLFMLEAGAAAGAGWDLKFLCGVEELLLEPSIQVLQVSFSRSVVVMVDVDVRLVFAVMMDAMAIAVLVLVTFMMVDVMETVTEVCVLITHRFLGVQRGPLTLRCSAVLPHLVDEKYFGHVVYDEHLSPVRDRLGLSTTEMNVHDEDGERGGGCDHSHSGYVVLP